MTVERNKTWGRNAPLGPEGVVVRSDAEARALVEACRRRGEPPPPLGLLGGDLCRSLGGRGDEGRLRSADAVTAQVDLGMVLADGRLHCFVAHAVARSGWWHGRIVAAMNAEWLGSWDVAPRAHPGDGLLDVLDGDPGLRVRWQVRRRLPTGAHLPHPDIAADRTRATQLELRPALDLWLDGERVATGVRNLSLRVEADALTVVV